MIYEIKRALAKRKLKKKIKEWKEFCIRNRIRHSNENIAICRFMLAEIIMLRAQFLPWGKYFLIEPYGFSWTEDKDKSVARRINYELISMDCGTMDCVLNYDLRMTHHLEFHEPDKAMWVGRGKRKK